MPAYLIRPVSSGDMPVRWRDTVAVAWSGRIVHRAPVRSRGAASTFGPIEPAPVGSATAGWPVTRSDPRRPLRRPRRTVPAPRSVLVLHLEKWICLDHTDHAHFGAQRDDRGPESTAARTRVPPVRRPAPRSIRDGLVAQQALGQPAVARPGRMHSESGASQRRSTWTPRSSWRLGGPDRCCARRHSLRSGKRNARDSRSGHRVTTSINDVVL